MDTLCSVKRYTREKMELTFLCHHHILFSWDNPNILRAPRNYIVYKYDSIIWTGRMNTFIQKEMKVTCKSLYAQLNKKRNFQVIGTQNSYKCIKSVAPIKVNLIITSNLLIFILVLV